MLEDADPVAIAPGTDLYCSGMSHFTLNCPSESSRRYAPKHTRDYHPAKHTRATGQAKTTRRRIEIPKEVERVELKISGREVRLTNLNKLFWPELKITKRDLLQYYADVSPLLLPHLKDRAMVMKRYPNGAAGRILFHEARALAAAALDRVVFDPSWLGKCDRLSDHSGSAGACCG